MNVRKRGVMACLILVACATASAPSKAQLVAGPVACTNGGALTVMGALACSGAWTGNNSGTPNLAGVLSQLSTDWSKNSYAGAGSTWSYLGGNDNSLNPFSNSSTGTNGGTSGTLLLNGTQTGWFAIALKAGNAFSLYLFNGGTTGISSVNFITDGTSYTNGHAQGLSHASMYGASGINVTATPEPSAWVLVLSGVAVMGVIGRVRRRRIE